LRDSKVGELDSKIAAIYDTQVEDQVSNDVAKYIAEELNYIGMTSVEQLANNLVRYEPVLLKLTALRKVEHERKLGGQLVAGISLFYLFQVVIALKGTAQDVIDAFDKSSIGPSDDERRKLAEGLYSHVQEAVKELH
jgi:hypothetical protein